MNSFFAIIKNNKKHVNILFSNNTLYINNKKITLQKYELQRSAVKIQKSLTNDIVLWFVHSIDNNKKAKNKSEYLINIKIKNNQTLNLKLYFVPINNAFYIDARITAVAIDNSVLNLQTDLVVKEALGSVKQKPKEIRMLLKENNVRFGHINIDQHLLFFDNAQIYSIPEYSILPAGIEQVHGMVIYSLEPVQKFFLRNRGISNVKKLFV